MHLPLPHHYSHSMRPSSRQSAASSTPTWPGPALLTQRFNAWAVRSTFSSREVCCTRSLLPCVTPQASTLLKEGEAGRPVAGLMPLQYLLLARARTQGFVCMVRPPPQRSCFKEL